MSIKKEEKMKEEELSVSTGAIEASTPKVSKKDVKLYKRKTKSSFKDFYKKSSIA